MNTEESSIEKLWQAGLEMLVHQVLYIRRLYPQESFCPTIFLDIKCKVNRHPGVVEYISQAVEMAVSAVMADDSREISIVLLDQETAMEYESYRICFDETPSKDERRKSELEQELRNTVLSVHSLEGLKSPQWPLEATFKIMILLTSSVKTSVALKEAIRVGAWYSPGDELSRPLGSRRPIHEMNDFGCRLYSEFRSRS